MPKTRHSEGDIAKVTPTSGQRGVWRRARTEPERRQWLPLAGEAVVRPLSFLRDAPAAETIRAEVLLKPRLETVPPASETVVEQSQPPDAPPVQVSRRVGWVRKNGHTVTSVLLLCFTLVIYTRPVDWWDPKSGVFPWIEILPFYIGAATLAVFFVVQIITDGHPTARPREFWYLVALVLLAGVSIPFSVDRWYARYTFNEMFIRAVLMFVVIINVLRNERRWRWLMGLSWAVGVWFAWDAFSKYRAGEFAIEGYRIVGAIMGMFGNPNDLSQHLVTMIPITVGFLLSAPRNAAELRQGHSPPPGVLSLLIVLIPRIIRRMGYLICLCVLLLGTMVTFSRSGFLATFTSTLVMTWKFGRKRRVFLMGCVLVVAIGVLAASPGAYRARVLSIFDSDLEVDAGKGSAEERKGLLQKSIKSMLRYPFLGLGMGGFRYKYDIQTHNAYTQVGAEMGVLALVAYLFFLFSPLKRLREIEQATYGTPDQRRFYYMAVCLQASLVAYMVGSFFGSIAYYYNVYYLVGYAVTFRMLYYNAIGISVNAMSLDEGRTPKSNSNELREQKFGWAEGSTG